MFKNDNLEAQDARLIANKREWGQFEKTEQKNGSTFLKSWQRSGIRP